MRIIGGTAKGHTIKAPKGVDTRPTLDRVRESVFNVLSNRGIFGTHVLDIFSGTGAVAIEALSRGAAHAVAVDFKTGKLILENAKHCRVDDRLEIIPRKLSQLKNYIMKEMHMSNVIKKIHWSSMLLRCIWMIIGALIYTVGLDLFLVPNNIIDGGVVGISLMTAELTGISFSIFVVLINIPFLYIGYRINGKVFTISTLFSIVWMAIFSSFAHEFTPITTNPFLGAIFGGIILGIGVGLIIRNGGCLDGSEIVAIIFDKRTTFSVGEIVMAMNLIILGAAGFVYSWDSAMYSLVAYFIAYKMIDITITGLEESKGVMIITDAENSERIADTLNAKLNRGVTILYGEGGYLKTPKHALYSVVTRLEITRLKDAVYEVDPSAFITIQDVHDVFGGRFTKSGH